MDGSNKRTQDTPCICGCPQSQHTRYGRCETQGCDCRRLEPAEAASDDCATAEAMTSDRCPGCGTLWQLHDGPTLLCRRIASLEESAAFGLQCYQDRCENAYVETSVVKRLEQQLATLRESMRAIAEGAVDPVFCAKSALERLKDGNAVN